MTALPLLIMWMMPMLVVMVIFMIINEIGEYDEKLINSQIEQQCKIKPNDRYIYIKNKYKFI